jgi:hypothetical protein
VKLNDLTGQCFGRLTVVNRAQNKGNNTYWFCQCACGITKEISGGNLRFGMTSSCGCLRRELAARRFWRHGHNRIGHETREYRSWRSIKQRCFNPKDKAYVSYGQRGISMSEAWQASFIAFLADVGPSPGKGWSLDRTDVNGHYEPGNCKWILATLQARNRRNNKCITHAGQTLVRAEWARKLHIYPNRLKRMLDKGFSMSQIFVKIAEEQLIKELNNSNFLHPGQVVDNERVLARLQ